jgi:osmotically-inducible protein OsmY
MRSDLEIRQDVEAELGWSPDLDDTDISVKAQGGVVLLTGFVRSFVEKDRAESAAKRVRGVAGIANDIQVRITLSERVPDPEIARAAVLVLQNAAPALCEHVKVIVSHGHLRLEGAVEWNFQKAQAEEAVRHVRGVSAVTNLIQVTPKVQPAEIERRIDAAFRRNATVDAEGICVSVHDGEVTLKGIVASLSEREEAERTAWSAPGVSAVLNELAVRPERREL